MRAPWIPLLLLGALRAATQEAPQEPKKPEEPIPDAVPVPDRWRIPFPDYPLNEPGRLHDPYRQNVLKGDYPILGQNIFLSVTGRSDTTVEFRRLPTPSGASTARSGRAGFFGEGEQIFFNQDFAGTVELFRGETSFRPRDWEARVTGVVNYTYLKAQENLVVDPSVLEETTRPDRYGALQEALVEVHLADVSENYDFVSLRAGIQPFSSDFRGLLFSDTNLGARLFGTLASNRVQWNAALFNQLEKDTNSELNTPHSRGQVVGIANVYVQDFLWPGYTTQVSIHVSRDDGDTEYDENDFLVRPALMGTLRPHEVEATYLGWAGDGHVGAVNVTHAFYAAFGRDEFNPLAGRETDVRAYLAAAEVSTDVDWARLRGSFLWASGDRDPADADAEGFDSIFEAPQFAGGTFGFWNRQAVRLQGVNLVNRNSHLPDLRSSKTQGQLNFVNPGIVILNAGLDVDVTPEVKLALNATLLRFHRTEPLEAFTFQPKIGHDVGYDASVGVTARPWLNNNAVLTVAAAAFFPREGFVDLYEDRETLFSLFVQLTLVY